MDATHQILTVFVLLGMAVFFAGSAVRHRRARAAMAIFVKEYGVVCEDERVSVEVLETMRNVFQVSCRWCAATTILLCMLLYKYSDKYRRDVDLKNALRNKNLHPEAARHVLAAYEALFDYACYAVPLFGAGVRWLISNVGMQAARTTKPGIFLATGTRITTPFRPFSWRTA